MSFSMLDVTSFVKTDEKWLLRTSAICLPPVGNGNSPVTWLDFSQLWGYWIVYR